MSVLSFWGFVGALYLMILTYQDYRENRLVDDRKNWFMLGVTSCLIYSMNLKLWYLLVLISTSIILTMFLNFKKVLGEADINSLSWIFLGFGATGTFNVLWFFLVFSILTAIYFGAKRLIFKKKRPTPFYGIILLSFLTTITLFRIY